MDAPERPRRPTVLLHVVEAYAGDEVVPGVHIRAGEQSVVDGHGRIGIALVRRRTGLRLLGDLHEGVRQARHDVDAARVHFQVVGVGRDSLLIPSDARVALSQVERGDLLLLLPGVLPGGVLLREQRSLYQVEDVLIHLDRLLRPLGAVVERGQLQHGFGPTLEDHVGHLESLDRTVQVACLQ